MQLPEEVNNIIKTLKLEAHQEGGWYRRVYCSEATLSPEVIGNYTGPRPLATSTYYMMTNENFSAFHRLKFDERWYHHSGDVVNIVMLLPDGKLKTMELGPAEKGFEPQVNVPGNIWFAAQPKDPGTWALVSCSMSPGFDYSDFELAEYIDLMRAYPEYRGIIEKLTHN